MCLIIMNARSFLTCQPCNFIGSCGLFFERSENFRARKASCQTAIRFFWKGDLLTRFWCKKNQGNCGTRNKARKVSGPFKNRPHLSVPYRKEEESYNSINIGTCLRGARCPRLLVGAKWRQSNSVPSWESRFLRALFFNRPNYRLIPQYFLDIVVSFIMRTWN